MTYALQVKDLVKRYGDVHAVDGISFDVPTASVFTILGPNGAGKTTTLEMLEGIREPDAGEITMLGKRMLKVSRAAKQHMGVLLQDGGFEPHLKVREILQLFSSFFDRALPVSDILHLVALEEKAAARVKTLSGGQKQRMAIGAALVNDPDLVFFDEPTTGLDPQARRNIWDILSELKSRGKTILLTTHYMEEAEALSDVVCIMDQGKIIAQGSPRELAAGLGEETLIEFRLDDVDAQTLQPLESCCKRIRIDASQVLIETLDLRETMSQLLDWAEKTSKDFHDLRVRQPNLEDVFLSLTGRTLRE